MNPQPTFVSRTRTKVSVIILTLLIGVFVTTWGQMNARASQLPTLDDETLQGKALTLANNFGLKGEPQSAKMMRMTLKEALSLTGDELGKDAGQFGLSPEMPVFVFAVRGEIESTGPGQVDPNNPNPKYDRMLIVLNAQNGYMIMQGDYYVDAKMPIELP